MLRSKGFELQGVPKCMLLSSGVDEESLGTAMIDEMRTVCTEQAKQAS